MLLYEEFFYYKSVAANKGDICSLAKEKLRHAVVIREVALSASQPMGDGKLKARIRTAAPRGISFSRISGQNGTECRNNKSISVGLARRCSKLGRCLGEWTWLEVCY